MSMWPAAGQGTELAAGSVGWAKPGFGSGWALVSIWCEAFAAVGSNWWSPCSFKTKAQSTESCRPDFFFSRGRRILDAEGHLDIIQPMLTRKRTR